MLNCWISCELSYWLDPEGPLCPALFREAHFWHVPELLPTEKEAPPFTAPARGFQKEPQHFA